MLAEDFHEVGEGAQLSTDRLHVVIGSTPRPAAPVATLLLLRNFELRVGHRLLVLPHNVQRVVAFLAVRERPQVRSTVASTLWMDVTEQRAAANLRTALWRLRRTGIDVVEASGPYLALAGAVDVDLHRLTGQARRLVAAGGDLEEADTDPDGLGDDLLPEWDEDWILYERERLRQLRVHALEALAGRLTSQRRFGEAIDVAHAAVAADPLRESAHRCLIQAHLAEANVGEARRQYELLRALLGDQLGVAPSVELDHLCHGTASEAGVGGR